MALGAQTAKEEEGEARQGNEKQNILCGHTVTTAVINHKKPGRSRSNFSCARAGMVPYSDMPSQSYCGSVRCVSSPRFGSIFLTLTSPHLTSRSTFEASIHPQPSIPPPLFRDFLSSNLLRQCKQQPMGWDGTGWVLQSVTILELAARPVHYAIPV